tara:strand:+ start:569 stop:937 length:369 start_codon:yes stop_codon:yes gene_type:complete
MMARLSTGREILRERISWAIYKATGAKTLITTLDAIMDVIAKADGGGAEVKPGFTLEDADPVQATTTFKAVDVADALNISEAKAAEWLARNKSHIESKMVSAGWSAIETLAAVDGLEGGDDE